MLDLTNDSDFRERFEELKEEYARKRGYFGEDDEFASSWWENDEHLHDAEEYAYSVISKERLSCTEEQLRKLPTETLRVMGSQAFSDYYAEATKTNVVEKLDMNFAKLEEAQRRLAAINAELERRAIEKAGFELSLNDCAKSLVDKMRRVYNGEIERLGSFEGTEVCFPFVKTLEDAAAWYLLTYDTDALSVLHEHATDCIEGYDNNSCFGFQFRDVRTFIIENCALSNLSLEDQIKQANEIRGQADKLLEKQAEKER